MLSTIQSWIPSLWNFSVINHRKKRKTDRLQFQQSHCKRSVFLCAAAFCVLRPGAFHLCALGPVCSAALCVQRPGAFHFCALWPGVFCGFLRSIWPGALHFPAPRLALLLRHRKRHLHLKQIPVNVDLKVPALELGQAFCDGKPQAAPFRGSGHVAADEPFRQLLGPDV